MNHLSDTNSTQSQLRRHIQNTEADFVQLILERLGINTHPQNNDLHNIVLNACQKFKCEPYEYLQMLTTCPDNSPPLEFLISGITIGETYFYRDQHQMNLLKNHVLPELILRKREKRDLSIRIWSAGCASGEEIYTLTMMLHDLLPDIQRWKLNLLGTDINMDALKKAKLGHFNKWSMRSIAKSQLDTYFTEQNNQYILSSKIIDKVDFLYLNLNDATYPSLLNGTNSQDLILCRNVLIYFNKESILRLMKKISLCLADEGKLLLGASDPVYIDGFNLVFHHNKGMLFSRQDIKSQVENNSTQKIFTRSKCIDSRTSSKNQSPKSKTDVVLTDKKPMVADTISNLIEKANKAANTGQLQEAVAYCEQSLTLDSTNKEAYFILALTLIELNRLDEAEINLRKTLFLDYKFIEGHFQLGLLLLKKKSLTEGLKSLQNALTIVNTFPPLDIVPGSQGINYARFAEILKAEKELYSRTGVKQ